MQESAIDLMAPPRKTLAPPALSYIAHGPWHDKSGQDILTPGVQHPRGFTFQGTETSCGSVFSSRGASAVGARARCPRRCAKRPSPRSRRLRPACVASRCPSALRSFDCSSRSDDRVALRAFWSEVSAAWRLVPALKLSKNMALRCASLSCSCFCRSVTPFDRTSSRSRGLASASGAESSSSAPPEVLVVAVRRTLEAMARNDAAAPSVSSSSSSASLSSAPSSSSSCSSLLPLSALSSCCF
mmetsp:Transcript_158887/g.385923  ORF Transcript_158887/g.385923 Transcript_158887/m.385923 type:complete len:242 (-) Transcript_158887:736-1461(-)